MRIVCVSGFFPISMMRHEMVVEIVGVDHDGNFHNLHMQLLRPFMITRKLLELKVESDHVMNTSQYCAVITVLGGRRGQFVA